MSSLETVLTIIIALGYRNNLWLVGYGRLNLFVCPKITFLEGIFFNFEKREKSQGLESDELLRDKAHVGRCNAQSF